MLTRDIMIICSYFILCTSIFGCEIDKNSIVILVNQDMMKKLSLPEYKDIVYLTNSKNPITNFNDFVNIGMTDQTEIAIGTRAGEGDRGIEYSLLVDLLKLANARIIKERGTLRTRHFADVPHAKAFIENPDLRLLITHKDSEKEITANGGIKIKFNFKSK